jgi:RNA polymerase sigma-70 factor (ECF subfamily)
MKEMSAPAMQAALAAQPAVTARLSIQEGEAVGEGLVRAFNELRNELVGTLVYLLGNREDAQDAAQETFMKCWRAQEELPGVQNLRAYIFRVAMNTATDMHRSAWRRKARPMGEEEMYAAPAASHSGSIERDEELERVRRAIRGLRREEQEVFLLRQNGEMTYEQIAEVRQVPVGTVKTQMRSALQKLRSILQQEP